MKTRTIAMVMVTMMASAIFTGCGSVKVSTKTPEATPIAAPAVPTADDLTGVNIDLTLSADKGWDADSTPAILHIDSETDESVDFYHAISPDAEGGKGNTTVTLAEGTYTVEFVSPLNHDGSAYEIFDMGSEQEITVEFGKDMAIDCEMKQIPADQVTDEMIADIVNKTQTAITKGDDTLKGDKVKDMLDNLAQNVQNSPNASDETKELAGVVADTTEIPEETKTEDVKAENNVQDNSQNNGANETVNNNVQDNTVNNNSTVNNAPVNNNQNNAANNNQATTAPSAPVQTPAQTPSAPVVSEPQAPAHTHTWADHVVTTQEWVANMVTVPDYEEQTTYVWVCNCGAEMPSGTEDDHGMNHILAGEPANGHVESRTTTVQVGSHTEDQGHYETKNTVDYRYCTGCGERQ